MHATNFSKKDIARFNSLLEFIQKNPFSKFYEDTLGKLTKVSSYEDFQNIPFLTKDTIINTPLEDRSFISGDDIKYYSVSS